MLGLAWLVRLTEGEPCCALCEGAAPVGLRSAVLVAAGVAEEEKGALQEREGLPLAEALAVSVRCALARGEGDALRGADGVRLSAGEGEEEREPPPRPPPGPPPPPAEALLLPLLLGEAPRPGDAVAIAPLPLRTALTLLQDEALSVRVGAPLLEPLLLDDGQPVALARPVAQPDAERVAPPPRAGLPLPLRLAVGEAEFEELPLSVGARVARALGEALPPPTRVAEAPVPDMLPP